MKPITHRSILMAFVNEPRVNVLTSNNNIATTGDAYSICWRYRALDNSYRRDL